MRKILFAIGIVSYFFSGFPAALKVVGDAKSLIL